MTLRAGISAPSSASRRSRSCRSAQIRYGDGVVGRSSRPQPAVRPDEGTLSKIFRAYLCDAPHHSHSTREIPVPSDSDPPAR
jgi:hypothetical protein